MKIRLETRDGHLVHECETIPYKFLPDAFTWGIRLFLLADRTPDGRNPRQEAVLPVYREIIAFALIDANEVAVKPVEVPAIIRDAAPRVPESVAPVIGSLTTDRNDPRLQDIEPSGQQSAYIVLSEEERAKGFVRPVRQKYKHVGLPPTKNPMRELTEAEKTRYADCGYVKYEAYPQSESSVVGRFWTQEQLDRIANGCGTVTHMGRALAETYAHDPSFYVATFCCGCGTHLPVEEFVWKGTDERVGT